MPVKKKDPAEEIFESAKDREEEEEVEVQAPDDDEEDEDDEPEPAQPQRDDGARRKKKRERDQRRLDDIVNRRLEEKLAQERQRWEEQHRASLNTVVSELRRQPEQPKPDPLQEGIALAQERQRQIIQEWNSLPDADRENPSKLREYQERLQKEREKEFDLQLDLREKRREAQRPQRQAEDPIIVHAKGTYPDVFADDRARQYAQSKWLEWTAEGEQPSAQLYLKTLEAARKKFFGDRGGSVGGGPSDAERARLRGSSRGSGTGKDRPVTTITKAEERMATARFPGIPKEQAVKKWIKAVRDRPDA